MAKKNLLTILITYCLTVIQALWSMKEYSYDHFPIGSLLTEALLSPVASVIFLTVIFAPVLILSNKIKIKISAIIFISISFIYAISIDDSIGLICIILMTTTLIPLIILSNKIKRDIIAKIFISISLFFMNAFLINDKIWLICTLFITTLLIPVVILSNQKKLKVSVKIFTSLLLFIIYAFHIDYGIYDYRYASWSTFTTAELLFAVFYESLLGLVISAVALWVYLKYYYFK